MCIKSGRILPRHGATRSTGTHTMIPRCVCNPSSTLKGIGESSDANCFACRVFGCRGKHWFAGMGALILGARSCLTHGTLVAIDQTRGSSTEKLVSLRSTSGKYIDLGMSDARETRRTGSPRIWRRPRYRFDPMQILYGPWPSSRPHLPSLGCTHPSLRYLGRYRKNIMSWGKGSYLGARGTTWGFGHSQVSAITHCWQ